MGYPCMMGDIASTAGLTVHKPDDGLVHFARWRPFDLDDLSRSAVPSPARENDGACRGSTSQYERLPVFGLARIAGGSGIGLGVSPHRNVSNLAVEVGVTRTLLRSCQGSGCGLIQFEFTSNESPTRLVRFLEFTSQTEPCRYEPSKLNWRG
jgi:hypothetical protein